jgi:hypothetical protein
MLGNRGFCRPARPERIDSCYRQLIFFDRIDKIDGICLRNVVDKRQEPTNPLLTLQMR